MLVDFLLVLGAGLVATGLALVLWALVRQVRAERDAAHRFYAAWKNTQRLYNELRTSRGPAVVRHSGGGRPEVKLVTTSATGVTPAPSGSSGPRPDRGPEPGADAKPQWFPYCVNCAHRMMRQGGVWYYAPPGGPVPNRRCDHCGAFTTGRLQPLPMPPRTAA